eukprot:13082-Heterococcus_DN1.PRE.4
MAGIVGMAVGVIAMTVAQKSYSGHSALQCSVSSCCVRHSNVASVVVACIKRTLLFVRVLPLLSRNECHSLVHVACNTVLQLLALCVYQRCCCCCTAVAVLLLLMMLAYTISFAIIAL